MTAEESVWDPRPEVAQRLDRAQPWAGWDLTKEVSWTMNRSSVRIRTTGLAGGVLALLMAILLGGCASKPEQGTLAFQANGEDFVRQGFVAKDGWTIDFDHVYVTLAEVTVNCRPYSSTHSRVM